MRSKVEPWVIVLTCAIVGVLVLSGFAVWPLLHASRPSTLVASKAADVTFDCTKVENPYLPSVRFDIRVHNAGKVTRSYAITLDVFDRSMTRVGHGLAYVSSVPAGTDARQTGSALVSGSLAGTQCSIEVS